MTKGELKCSVCEGDQELGITTVYPLEGISTVTQVTPWLTTCPCPLVFSSGDPVFGSGLKDTGIRCSSGHIFAQWSDAAEVTSATK